MDNVLNFPSMFHPQDIRELQIEDFDRGGVNVTGLSLTDFSEEDNNEILRKWKVLQRTQHRNETLTVSMLSADTDTKYF